MAFKHGRNAAVYFNETDLSPYLNALDMSVDVDTSDTTTFGSTWKSALPGTQGCTVGFGGLYDPTLVDLAEGVDTEGNVLTWCPAGGSALGDRARLALVASTSYAEGSPVGDVVSVGWDVLTSGTVGFGDIIHPLTARTSSANGTAVDMVASSSTGAIAHLHVTSVSASDSIIVTIEDSANGSSDWQEIGEFSEFDAVGAERITIAGTVRRYVRAVWAVTGSGVSIPFIVALART